MTKSVPPLDSSSDDIKCLFCITAANSLLTTDKTDFCVARTTCVARTNKGSCFFCTCGFRMGCATHDQEWGGGGGILRLTAAYLITA